MITVIIPAYNDGHVIRTTIDHLRSGTCKRLVRQMIVVDGGSDDMTVREALAARVTVVSSNCQNRGALLNAGAMHATERILYFVAADAIPPCNYANEIVRTVRGGYSYGWFLPDHPSLSLHARALNFVVQSVCGYASIQTNSLFVVRELFEKCGKFREDMRFLEDADLIERLSRYSSRGIPGGMIVPPRPESAPRRRLAHLVAWSARALGLGADPVMRAYCSVMGRDGRDAAGRATAPAL